MRSRAFEIVSLPLAGAPWMKISFISDCIGQSGNFSNRVLRCACRAIAYALILPRTQGGEGDRRPISHQGAVAADPLRPGLHDGAGDVDDHLALTLLGVVPDRPDR